MIRSYSLSFKMIVLILFQLRSCVCLSSAPSLNEDIRISFRASKDHYLYGEPIDVIVEIDNNTTNRLFFGASTLRSAFTFTAQTGANVKRLEPSPVLKGFSRAVIVAPRRGHEDVLVLNQYLMFREPGSYVISVASLQPVPFWVGQVRADTVSYVSVEDAFSVELTAASEDQLQAIGERIAADLHDDEDEVRALAVQKLSVMQGPTAVRALSTALEDPAPEVRYEAAHALGNIGSREAVKALVAALESSNADTKRRALHEIRKLRVKSALPVVLRLLDNDSADVRLSALDTIRVIGDETCRGAVERAMRDDDEMVRQLAEEVYQSLTSP